MGKLLAAAMLTVICVEPVRHDGECYKPGDELKGLSEKQAAQLVDGGHATYPDQGADSDSDGDGDGATGTKKPAATKTSAKK